MAELTIPDWFHVGVFLHTSCNNEWWGPVTRIDHDENKRLVVDFSFDGRLVHEFVTRGETDLPNNCEVHIPDGPCYLSDVPVLSFSELTYSDHDAHFVRLETPGDGCSRCSSHFSVHDARGA